jgi:MFS-type transporter involved in bile tolerance (Atg22 family)
VVPILVAVVTGYTQDQRAGFAVVTVFLVAGFLGLFFVTEERAIKAPRH